MNDVNENFVNVYIKKQEDNLLYHVRKQLESETKVSLLELIVNEKTKEIENLKNNINELNETIKQAINGITTLTNEKDVLEKRLVLFNEQTLLENRIKDLENKLKISEEAYNTLENNYNIVLKSKKIKGQPIVKEKQDDGWVT